MKLFKGMAYAMCFRSDIFKIKVPLFMQKNRSWSGRGKFVPGDRMNEDLVMGRLGWFFLLFSGRKVNQENRIDQGAFQTYVLLFHQWGFLLHKQPVLK